MYISVLSKAPVPGPRSQIGKVGATQLQYQPGPEPEQRLMGAVMHHWFGVVSGPEGSTGQWGGWPHPLLVWE